jgi:uncharacterized phage infection (PIP) family protein YhgE
MVKVAAMVFTSIVSLMLMYPWYLFCEYMNPFEGEVFFFVQIVFVLIGFFGIPQNLFSLILLVTELLKWKELKKYKKG